MGKNKNYILTLVFTFLLVSMLPLCVSAATLINSSTYSGEGYRDNDYDYEYDPSPGIEGLGEGNMPSGEEIVFNIGDIIESDYELKIACANSGGKYTFTYGISDDIKMINGNVSDNMKVTYTVPKGTSLIGKFIRVEFRISYYRELAADFIDYFNYNFEADDLVIAGNIEDANISGITGKTFTGSEIEQDPTIVLESRTLEKGRDYNLEYGSNINAGRAIVIITGTGYYYGKVIKEFVISPKEISAPAGISLTYNGKPQTGVKAGTGYTVSGNTGTDAGTYTATISLDKSGNYIWNGGTKEDKKVSWKIDLASISTAVVSGIADAVYTGKAIVPNPVVKAGDVTLTSGTDYTVGYSNNIEVGTATVKITGMGNYTGSVSKTFKITKLSEEPDNKTEDQKAEKAARAVVKGKTYTVSKMKYKVTNADRNGRGTVTLTGTNQKKTKLTKLTVPKTVKINGVVFKVTAIGNKAFYKFTKIKTVTIGDNVKAIGISAFAGNTALTKVTIGKGVAKIEKTAFSGDRKLKTISIKSTKLKSVGKNAIKGIYKKAAIMVPKKQLKKYKKLFSAKTGFKKTMKIKK